MLLQAMSALPGKDWYLGGSKGFEGKKGPFGKTPEKLQQCFINTDGRTDVVQSFYAPEWLQSMEGCTFLDFMILCDAPRDCGLDNFTSLSNRRLAALLMFQALHRDRCIKAWCKILVVSDNTESRSGGGNR